MQATRYFVFFLAVMILLATITTSVAAASYPSSSVTYTIDIRNEGTAVWHVEYRTLLATDEDLAAFDSYAKDIPVTYLPQFKDLMQRSAAQASAATARPMSAMDFTGDAVVQTTPTGRYGVVFYSCSWSGFAQQGADLAVGDAFAGGLYLAKDHSLIIHFPDGYAVKSADPVPDQVRNGLIWYGLRSFGAGEPRVVLEKAAFPPAAVALILAFAGIAVVLIIFLRIKKRRVSAPATTPDPPASLSEAEITSLEERIIDLLNAHGGELYQSEIVHETGQPKSTVSSVLNELHLRGIIQKVKKGRENLIRLSTH